MNKRRHSSETNTHTRIELQYEKWSERKKKNNHSDNSLVNARQRIANRILLRGYKANVTPNEKRLYLATNREKTE